MLKRILALILALVGTFLAIYLSTGASATYSSFGGGAAEWINQAVFASSLSSGEVVAVSHFGWKMFGHILLYLLTGLAYSVFLNSFPDLKKKNVILFGIGLALSIIGEVTQFSAAGRSVTFGDVLINFASFMALPVLIGLGKKTY